MNITTFAAINLMPSFFYGWIIHYLLQYCIWPPSGISGVITSTAITLAPIGTIITKNPIFLIPNGLITIIVGAIYYIITSK